MKKKSHQDSTRKHAFVLGGVSIIFLLVFFFARGTVSNISGFLFTPVSSVSSWVSESSGKIPTYIRTKESLASEIVSLKNELRTRERDASLTKALTEENAALAALLKFSSADRVAARILLHPNDTPYDTFIVDKGNEAGIQKGATVYREDVAIGTVARVYSGSALVRLVSSPGVISKAFVFGPNIFVDAEGIGGGVLKLSVPHDIPFAVGDVVALPVSGEGVYGEIVDVESVDSNPFQYGYVSNNRPLSSLRFVHIGTTVSPDISYEEVLDVVEQIEKTMFSVQIPDEFLVGTTTDAVGE